MIKSILIKMDGKTIAAYPLDIAVELLLPPYIILPPMRVEAYEDEEGNIVMNIVPEEEEE